MNMKDGQRHPILSWWNFDGLGKKKRSDGGNSGVRERERGMRERRGRWIET